MTGCKFLVFIFYQSENQCNQLKETFMNKSDSSDLKSEIHLIYTKIAVLFLNHFSWRKNQPEEYFQTKPPTFINVES